MQKDCYTWSRPAWGAWIEIAAAYRIQIPNRQSRPAWGAWIEIRRSRCRWPVPTGRAPHGARGLKSMDSVDRLFALVVAPRTGRVD